MHAGGRLIDDVDQRRRALRLPTHPHARNRSLAHSQIAYDDAWCIRPLSLVRRPP
jgi:hypothetical protein